MSEYKIGDKFIIEIEEIKQAQSITVNNIYKIKGTSHWLEASELQELERLNVENMLENPIFKGMQDNKLSISDMAAIISAKNVQDNSMFYNMLALFLGLRLGGSNDSYYKGRCDAYENVFMPKKQSKKEFKKFKKVLKNLNKKG